VEASRNRPEPDLDLGSDYHAVEVEEAVEVVKPPRVPRGIKGPWVRCARPGCLNVISADAYPRVTFCGHCQLRARELNWEAGAGPLDPEQMLIIWEPRERFPVREAASFLKMPLRTLYNLLTAGKIAALRNRDGKLCISRRDLLALYRDTHNIIGLREAAEEMGIDYSYLRELVRRGVVPARQTFWGHYGLGRAEMPALKATIFAALPQDNEYSLSSFARLLGVHHSLPQKWIRQGKLRAKKGLTGRVIIARTEAEHFLNLVKTRPAFLPLPVREKVLASLAGLDGEKSTEAFGG